MKWYFCIENVNVDLSYLYSTLILYQIHWYVIPLSSLKEEMTVKTTERYNDKKQRKFMFI